MRQRGGPSGTCARAQRERERERGDALFVEEARQDLGDELGAQAEKVVVPDDDLEELEADGGVREVDDLCAARAQHELAELRQRELRVVDAVLLLAFCALQVGVGDEDERAGPGGRDGLTCAART